MLRCCIITGLKTITGKDMKQDTMTLADAANAAIFHFQLPTQRAIRFVTSRARVDRNKAIKAIERTIIGYKTKAVV